MRYWWVNQNQTYDQETSGGYLWSPKRKANSARNHFYETMREVAPGDLVFSFSDTRIRAIGVARSFAYSSPKPAEFGAAGQNWDTDGWRVDVQYAELRSAFRPADHMDLIRPLLPAQYAPLQANGRGLQGVYLTELSSPLSGLLLSLAGPEAKVFQTAGPILGSEIVDPGQAEEVAEEWDDHIEEIEAAAHRGDEKTRGELHRARRGYGLFRRRVLAVERGCRLSGLTETAFLVCQHIKPWRYSSDQERLDGENGLLFCPNAGFLFARGLIGFDGNGDFLVARSLKIEVLNRLGLTPETHRNVGGFTPEQSEYLKFHRDRVFLKAVS